MGINPIRPNNYWVLTKNPFNPIQPKNNTPKFNTAHPNPKKKEKRKRKRKEKKKNPALGELES